ncbi:unnamed protein product, partial [Brassica rapa subsp. narinosa]
KDTKLLRNKKERCEVSPVAGKGNIVLIYKVNTVYRNVRENGYPVNYTFLSSYTPQFP